VSLRSALRNCRIADRSGFAFFTRVTFRRLSRDHNVFTKRAGAWFVIAVFPREKGK
jgi:hypothetical protein